jgi:hypothetical protein
VEVAQHLDVAAAGSKDTHIVVPLAITYAKQSQAIKVASAHGEFFAIVICVSTRGKDLFHTDKVRRGRWASAQFESVALLIATVGDGVIDTFDMTASGSGPQRLLAPRTSSIIEKRKALDVAMPRCPAARFCVHGVFVVDKPLDERDMTVTCCSRHQHTVVLRV